MSDRMRSTFSSLGLLVGVIIGAGMFALPYAVARAGIMWGIIHAFIAFGTLTLIHLLYGEVVFSTSGTHRLPGYVGKYLGKNAQRVSFFSALVGFYGALLVYGLLGGMFLNKLFGGESFIWSLLFFIIAGFVLVFDLRKIGTINFVLTFVLIAVIILLAILLMPHVDMAKVPRMNMDNWFLPYGVFLFAFAGASAIPDVADVFRKRNERLFRRVVVLSTLIPLLLYTLFITAVVGVMGTETPPDGISGLERFIGSKAIVFGSLMGLLAVGTSFLTLGTDLKKLFIYDYSLRHYTAWGIVVAVPLLLFLLGVTDFVAAIGVVGAVAVGIDGVLILSTALRVCQKNGGCRIGSFSIGRLLPVLLIVLLSAGVIYEVVQMF